MIRPVSFLINLVCLIDKLPTALVNTKIERKSSGTKTPFKVQALPAF